MGRKNERLKIELDVLAKILVQSTIRASSSHDSDVEKLIFNGDINLRESNMASLHVTAGRLCSIASPLPLRAANRLLTRHGQRPFSTTPVAPASHASQGVANGPKNGAGKRLGAKKYGGV
jgi:hypothetical protein